ncbi:MAG: hypothetical protein WCD42_06730 [Rhizomicrobium sp.]
MPKKIIFPILVVLLPLVVIAYFLLDGTVVIWGSNSGEQVTVAAVIVSGQTVEKSEPRKIAAGGRLLILFTPHTSGMLRLFCRTATQSAAVQADEIPLYAYAAQSTELGPVTAGDFRLFHSALGGCTDIRKL